MSMSSPYYDKALSKLLTKYCSFFAFNTEQYEAAANVNFKYVAGGSGLCVPTIFAKKVIDGIHNIHVKDIARTQAAKSNKDIIWGAFSNFECQINGDIQDAIYSLSDYPGISRDMIEAEYGEYFQHCIDNDYF